MPDAIFQLILGGLIAGVLAGLLGIGGGIILVPLIITLGYTPIQAVATSSLVIVISSTSGSIQNWRMGYLDLKRVIYLAIPALITAQLGVYLGTLIPAYLLLFLFSILLLINIYLIQLKKKLKSQQQVSSKTKSQRSLILSRLLTGSLGGLMAGLFGMGGGIIFVPFQMLLLGEPIKLAIQTSLGAIIVTSVSACIGHATNGNVLFAEGAILGAGGLVGSQFSTRILPKLPDTVVSLIFRVFLAVLSLYMFWQSWDSYRQESGVKFQEFIRGFFQVDFNLPSLFSPLALILFFSVLLNLFFLWLLVSRYYPKLIAKNTVRTVRTSNFLMTLILPFNLCKTWWFHWQYSAKAKSSHNANKNQTYLYQLPKHIQQELETLLIRKIGDIAIILLEQSVERKITYQEFFEKLSIFIPPKSLIWEEIWDLLGRHIPTTQIINCSFSQQSNLVQTVNSEKLNVEFLAACRTELEKAIGPIAKYVIREQIAKNPNLSKIELIEALAAQIPDRTIAREFRHHFATV